MTNQTLDSYMAHPLFQQAMENFQVGTWEAGLTQLDELRNQFPLDDDLRSLRQEMQLKSKIDEYEVLETKAARTQFIKNFTIRTFIGITVLGFMIWGGISYSSWIQQQWDIARQRVQNQAQEIDLSIQFRNAQNLLLAGRPEEAKVVFEQIAEISPDFDQLDLFLSESEAMILLDKQYGEAMILLDQGNAREALNLFKEIAAKKPLYKDVSLQISRIEREFLQEDMVAEANMAFQEEDWGDAITAYESILALNPTENKEDVEDRLFQSYISAAEATLADPEGTIEALESAEQYFKKALALRPQNQLVLEKWADARETINERLVNSYLEKVHELLGDGADSLDALNEAVIYLNKALELQPDSETLQSQAGQVQNYLKAIDAYRKNTWTEVILLLGPIVEENPEFAKGTTLQTLYEAYIARGNDASVGGLYEAALADYQSAAVIAQQSSKSALLVFEAQIKAAETQGLLFNYEGAVALYQSAIDYFVKGDNTLPDNIQRQISDAEVLIADENFRSAYLTYRGAFNDKATLYANSVVHVVQENEYLTMIANRYNTTVQAIVEANGIQNPNKIFVGQELIIPILEN